MPYPAQGMLNCQILPQFPRMSVRSVIQNAVDKQLGAFYRAGV